MELAPKLPEQDWGRGEDRSLRDTLGVLMKVYYLKQILLIRILNRDIFIHSKTPLKIS